MARGYLRQTPLPEFLVQAYDSQIEGTLLLQTATREKSAILFVRGVPAKARPAKNRIHLGTVAQELGLLSARDAKATERRAEDEGRPHADIIREEQVMDDTSLFVLLREQLLRQVMEFCELPDTTGFGFYKENYLAQWGPEGQWRLKPLRLVWRALVDHLPETRREAWLKQLGSTVLRIRPESPVTRYGLSDQEKSVLDMIRARASNLQDLLESGVGSPIAVKKTICALMLTRQLQLGSDRPPVGMHEPPESPSSMVPAPSRTPGPRVTVPRTSTLPSLSGERPGTPTPAPTREPPKARSGVSAEELRATVQAYQDRRPGTYYEVLGISRDADAATIRASFFQLARLWHPDRLPAELADLKPIVSRAFAAMGEAHQTLADDARRAEYDRALSAAPEDEQAQVAVVLDAAHAFQRAEVLMKKKDFVGAMKESKAAYDGDSTQADYAALYGWLQGMNRTDNFGELIQLLDSALEKNSDNVRALWYRGQLLKKAGQDQRAIKDFKKIVDLKPNHVDAQRELRVHAMRRRTGPTNPNTPSGIFGRFKKKT